jgi:GR25 family glycosyltransferase involved in LPS biosynthesis
MFGLYINLDSRDDRRSHMEEVIKKYDFFKNVIREPAVKKNIGYYGCTLSHINCLEKLKSSNDKYVMILEDDISIIDETNFKCFTEDFEKIKDSESWDVIVMTPRGDTVKDIKYNFKKIVNNQTATGYIIKTHFIPNLLEYFYKSKHTIETDIHHHRSRDALDIKWKPLQEKSNFLYYSKLYGSQLPQYSNIEKKYTNYEYAFLKQYER